MIIIIVIVVAVVIDMVCIPREIRGKSVCTYEIASGFRDRDRLRLLLRLEGTQNGIQADHFIDVSLFNQTLSCSICLGNLSAK